MNEGSTRAILAAFLANLGIAIAKFVAFLFTGAASMLAESIHSVADTGNQALLALGGRKGRQAPTIEHPFGFGRERYFWAFLVAVVLFTLGALFALFEGYEKLRHPHTIESPAWAFGALLVAIALESWSLRTAVHEADKVRAGQSWWRFIRRSKSPELPVVLLEDVGALLGLGCALVGVSLAVATGQSRFDAVGSLAIGLLLGVIAVTLGIEMRSLLIGEAASRAEVAAIQAALVDGPAVRRRCWSAPRSSSTLSCRYPRSLRRSTRPSSACGPRCRRRGSSTWSRTATGPGRRSNGPPPRTRDPKLDQQHRRGSVQGSMAATLVALPKRLLVLDSVLLPGVGLVGEAGEGTSNQRWTSPAGRMSGPAMPWHQAMTGPMLAASR
jgi:cation diffusion facilitator family transporter